jgi:Uncharacterized protein conserved in bacteria
MDRVDESERSKAIALKAIRGVFIERDARVVQELFAPDYIQHNPTIPSGRDAISALVGSLPEGFRYEPGMVVAEGSIVMIHGRYVGWAPEPMVAVDIFRVDNGRSSNTGMSCRPRSRPMKQIEECNVHVLKFSIMGPIDARASGQFKIGAASTCTILRGDQVKAR